MHTRSLVSLLIVACASCGGPTAPTDGGATDARPDGGPVEPCTRDLECGDQDLFCSDWRCRPGEPGTDARGCIDLGSPCDPGATCDEEMDMCGGFPAWCTEGRAGCMEPGNCDGDSEPSSECGGEDCDDDDGRRYPGGTEICDPDGVDEDCMSTTFGELDADGDGFTSAECCNGDACADDCDDSRREVYPGATEACNAIDDDCNGFVDDPGAFCPVGTCVDRRCRALSWEWTYGTVAADRIDGLAADDMGNVFAVLSLTGMTDVDGDGTEEGPGTLLVSLTAEGRHRWVRQLSDGYVSHELLEVSPSGDTLVAISEGTSLQWFSAADGSVVRTLPITPSEGWDSVEIVDLAWSADSLFVGGDLRMGSDRGILLLKLGSDGMELGRRVIDAAGTAQRIAALGANFRGDVVIVGESEGDLDLGGGVTISGGFLAALDSSLVRRWDTALPTRVGNFGFQPPDVAVAETGEVAVVGTYVGGPSAWGEAWPDLCPTGCRSMFVVSLGSDGSHRWSRHYRGTWDPTAPSRPSVAFDERGGVAVSGTFADTLDVRPHGMWTAGSAEGGCDAFLAVWDSTDASVLLARRITGPSCPENVWGTIVDPFGATILAGTYRTSITLLRGTYPSAGEIDAFLVRVSD